MDKPIMKILVISTYETHGGGSIAAKRLTIALNKTEEVEAKLLVNNAQTKDPQVIEVADTKLKKRMRKFRFILERILFIPYELSRKERYSFSTAYFGTDISQHPLVREADVLHLHWINQGFLSHTNLQQLIQLGKPIVVTMHDVWYFTGGCHYTRECDHFMRSCGNCILIKHPHPNDISHKAWKVKAEMYSDRMKFVACSNWLADLAKTSSLLDPNQVSCIPNPIDRSVFNRRDKLLSRKVFNLPEDKILILYVAVKVDNERKGYHYLSAALKTLFESNSPIKKDIEIVVMGGVDDPSLINFYFPTHFLGRLSNVDSIVSCYNAADLFIAPSLEDNLPNTIVESIACGTPVVAFNIGGIPDIIDHKQNGYLAAYKDTSDLINGIEWVLAQQGISDRCLEKAGNTFSEEVVSPQFIDLYKSLL
jgi:glycosyltransferase involved in cell wall biosynthesis